MTQGAKKRIVLAGPESSGKSCLTAHLAERFGVPHAKEYARIYMEQHGPAYDYDLLLGMSRAHRAYQKTCVPDTAPIGLLDTDLINYKIWSEVAYGRCHPEILEAIEQEAEHVYILCYPDLPWEPDPLREHPEKRLMLFERHLQEIERLGRRCRVISGEGRERYLRAEQAYQELR